MGRVGNLGKFMLMDLLVHGKVSPDKKVSLLKVLRGSSDLQEIKLSGDAAVKRTP